MRVFRAQPEIPADIGPSVVTIGNFDGVHAGHRVIMRRAGAIAKTRGLLPMVMTFDPHPAQVLAPERAPKLLMTIDQRLRNIATAEGIEAVWLCPFSLELCQSRRRKSLRATFWPASCMRGRCWWARTSVSGAARRAISRRCGHWGREFGFEVEGVGGSGGIGRHGARISSTDIRKAG